ncbi:MAG TPA: protease pro-enzyme activation domain-containing protein [Xanthomonadaceae bacterium]|jgi:PKD repeat protein
MNTIIKSHRSVHAPRLHAALAVAITTALCAAGAIAAPASLQSIAQPTRLHPGEAVIGALPMSQPIHVEVALKMRDRAGLDALIADNARKQAAHAAPHLLSTDDFLARYAPTQAQAKQVADYLAARGFTNIVIAPNRLLVSADGTAATARDAFMTTFAQVRTADGRIAYANTDEARVPTALAGAVLAVLGLQEVHQAQTPSMPTSPGVGTQAIQAHYPTEFSTIYGGANTAPASDVVVGLVTNGRLERVLTDLDAFARNSGLPPVNYTSVHTNGWGKSSKNWEEWDVDSQNLVGMAGGVKKLIFYVVPDLSNANLAADLNTIVAANEAKIIQASVGECEVDAQADGSAAADDAILAAAVAQGQTFSVTTESPYETKGPLGCAGQSWPASSPYVVSTSPTTLNASPTLWIRESGFRYNWTGPSTFEPQPSWQTALGVPGSTRDVPDVGYDGAGTSGSLVYEKLELTQTGGAGMASSLFAGAWARVLEARGPGLGFAAPVLYALPASDFHDITDTDNSREPAGPGYDMASGRGSMIIGNAITDSAGLGNQPPVANFTFTETGSTVDFTDLSTDSDGTIVKRTWYFGDGSPPSNATNPSHAYATTGFFTVQENVTDDMGATSVVKQQVAVNVGGPLQLLKNPSFETGQFSPWVAAFLGNTPNNVASKASNGTYEVLLENESVPGFDETLSQQVTLLSYKTTATLSVPVWVENEGLSSSAVDTMQIQVRDTSGHVLATLATFSNLDGNQTCTSNCPRNYVVHSYDMTPWIGQTVVLAFVAPGESTRLGTAFFVDNIKLTVQ